MTSWRSAGSFLRNERYLAINLAYGQGYSVKQILQTILEVDGFAEADVHFDPSKPSTTAIRLVDTTMAKELIGFNPTIDLRSGLARTVRWYRENATLDKMKPLLSICMADWRMTFTCWTLHIGCRLPSTSMDVP